MSYGLLTIIVVGVYAVGFFMGAHLMRRIIAERLGFPWKR